MTNALALCAVTAIIWLLSGCTSQLASPDYWPTEEWRTATPESQGIDSRVLAEMLAFSREKALPIHSLLIVRRGDVVMDEYFYPYSAGLRHDIASVTKSVTTTLVGIAIQEGYLPGTDTPVHQLLDGRDIRDWDAAKKQITLGHLLSMSSGLACGYKPGERELFDMRETSDWIQFTLDLPMRTLPGKEFAYCSSGMHLLSAFVTSATGQSLETFAATRLFQPLGIKDWYWPADPDGISHGWGDLQLHPRDMAKIGLLFLYDGVWDGKQLVATDWIAQATRHQVDTMTGASYGYGWWLSKLSGSTLIEARGRGGQRIVTWPEKDIVVVLTAGGFDTDELAPFLLRAVHSNKPLPDNPDAMAKLKDISAQLNTAPKPQTVARMPAMATQVSEHWYGLETNTLGLAALMLSFDGGQAKLGISLAGQRYVVPIGLDGVYRFSSQTPSKLPTGVRGHWNSKDTFVLEYDEIGRVNHFTFQLRFSGDSLLVDIDEPSGLYQFTVSGQLRSIDR